MPLALLTVAVDLVAARLVAVVARRPIGSSLAVLRPIVVVAMEDGIVRRRWIYNDNFVEKLQFSLEDDTLY